MHRLQVVLNHLALSSDSNCTGLQTKHVSDAENDLPTKQHSNGCFEIILKRPKALNSLSFDMINEFHEHLQHAIADSNVKLVLVRADTKSFCAGGDLKQFIAPDGRWRFSHAEYALDRKIYRLPKPYISLVDGFAMGGGVGISVHGKYRVVTENILWAMPEAIVGFLTDVGSTHFLARCPGKIGLYLALTGTKIKLEDAMHCGIGTHYIPSASLSSLAHALTSETIRGEGDIETILNKFAKKVEGKSPLKEIQEKIDFCFGADSVEEIIKRLQKDNSDWAKETLKALQHNCPMALKVIMETIKRAKEVDFEESISTELRAAVRLVERNDIQEGVRALLIDRDNCPKWQPATLEEITKDDVDSFFEPFEDRSKEQRFY